MEENGGTSEESIRNRGVSIVSTHKNTGVAFLIRWVKVQ